MSNSIRNEIRRSTKRIGRNATIAFRAERAISSRRFAVVRTQMSMFALAALICGIGIIMFSVAVFFWIAESVGNANAGLILAVVDFVLAGILVAIASRMTAEAELEPLIEIRDVALADIELELESALDDVTEIADGIRELTRNPLGSLAQSLIGPLLALLIKTYRSGDPDTDNDEAPTDPVQEPSEPQSKE